MAEFMEFIVQAQVIELQSSPPTHAIKTVVSSSEIPVTEMWRISKKLPMKKSGMSRVVDHALEALGGVTHQEILGQMVQDALKLTHGPCTKSSTASSSTSPWFSSPSVSSPPSSIATPFNSHISSPRTASLVLPGSISSGSATFVAGNNTPVIAVLPNTAPTINISTNSGPALYSSSRNPFLYPQGPTANMDGVYPTAPTAPSNTTAVEGRTSFAASMSNLDSTTQHFTPSPVALPPFPTQPVSSSAHANWSVPISIGGSGNRNGQEVEFKPGDTTPHGFTVQHDGNTWFQSHPTHAEELYDTPFWKKTITSSLPGNTHNESPPSLCGVDEGATG